MNKSVQTSHGILLSHKQGWTPDAHGHVDESQRHCAEQKELASNSCILYDSIYITYLENRNRTTATDNRSGAARGQRGGEGLPGTAWGSSGGDTAVLCPGVEVVVTWICTCAKIRVTTNNKKVQFFCM